VNGGDDERSTIAVLEVGAIHLGGDQQTGRVGHDVTLAAFNFLGRIKAARATGQDPYEYSKNDYQQRNFEKRGRNKPTFARFGVTP